MKNYRLFTIPFTLVLILAVSSCNSTQWQTRKTMRNFSKVEISIPESLHCIHNHTMTPVVLDTLHSNKFIIYYDWQECSSCKLLGISEMLPIYNVAYKNNCSVLMIFSPHSSNVESIVAEIFYADLDIPIYIDTEGTFKTENPKIPSDPIFHYFLIDETNRPIFVGNPIINEDLWNLFTQTIQIKTN